MSRVAGRTLGFEGLPFGLALLFILSWMLRVGGVVPDGEAWLLWHGVLLAGYSAIAMVRILRHGKEALRSQKASLLFLSMTLFWVAIRVFHYLSAELGGSLSGMMDHALMPGLWLLSLAELGTLNRRLRLFRLPTPFLAALGFAALILLGTVMLAMPEAGSRERLSLVDALFTATSASCVTGLSVVNTGADLTSYGQLVLLFLMQVGGLGILTVTSLFALLRLDELRLGSRLRLSEDLRSGTIHGFGRLLLWIFLLTAVAEGLGAAGLYFSAGEEFGRGWWRIFTSVFHSVSAFCNAGFTLFPDSMSGQLDRPLPLLITLALIMLGGLGFLLTLELLSWSRRRKRLSVQTRLVLGMSLLLWAVGTLFFRYSESDAALAGWSGGQAWLGAFFHSVSCRTAGFHVFPSSGLSPAGWLLTVVLMFIGAAPGSTGGGIKVSTFAMVLALVAGYFRGRTHLEIAGRSIPERTLREALAVLAGALAVAILATLLLLLVEGSSLDRGAFEVLSALGTVGLSTGLSPELGSFGKLLLVLVMYLGRVGLLTVALAVGGGRRDRHYRLPDEEVMVG